MESNSTLLANEARIRDFYLSGEPETTLKYPLLDYMGHTFIDMSPNKGGLGTLLNRDVKAGDLLFVENALVTCACVREYAPYTKGSYTQAPKHWFTPPEPRISPGVHNHLATKLETELKLDTSPMQNYEGEVRRLDARPPGTANSEYTNLLHENRGPWKTPGMKDLDKKKVWNIVANTAMCDKVRSISREDPIQVETCDFWGLWRVAPFINHSCDPNCHRMQVGGALIIRAAINIACGEELTLPYFDIFEPLPMRQCAASIWGFRCECGRCTFERSIGKPYETFQASIMDLKRRIGMAWTIKDVKVSRRKAEILLEKLSELTPKIYELIDILTQTSWDDDEFSSVLDETRNSKIKSWISASCIEPFIAFYVLCETRTSRISSDAAPILSQINPVTITRRSLEAKQILRKIMSIQTVLEVLNTVNPGNLLGQEFHHLLFEASVELTEVDVHDNLTFNLGVLENFTENGIQFLGRYYGFQGEEFLAEQLVTES